MEKTRLDVFLAEKGLAESREKARSYIKSGFVTVNGKTITKAGENVCESDAVEVSETCEFVSRGGYKLKKAIAVFSPELDGKICMDIGASTGGFTDCMLKNGAAKVYCVDVGSGQLSPKLLADGRVVNLEKTNIRYLTPSDIPDAIDFASIDVSFISLTLVLPAARELIRDGGHIVALVKPQFEAGKGNVGKKGVVKETGVHKEVILRITDFALNNGFSVLGLDYSPIKGPEGNIEYLVYLEKSGSPYCCPTDPGAVVALSHKNL